MRFAPALFFPAALTLAHCSSPVPATPDTAWVVNMTSQGPPCQIGQSSRSLGDVNSTTILTRVSDQQTVMGNTATVTCSVAPSGSGFSVNATATIGADSLTIVIPSIDKTASQASPAVGTVTYISDATVSLYSGNMCDFYFANGNEGIDSGKIWVAFTCAQITSAGTQSMCPVSESYAAFESCSTTPVL